MSLRWTSKFVRLQHGGLREGNYRAALDRTEGFRLDGHVCISIGVSLSEYT